MSEEFEYTKSNREKRLSPKKNGPFYCMNCDRNLVHVGERCSICNKLQGKRTIKKETNAN
jgi:hypothetical protein